MAEDAQTRKLATALPTVPGHRVAVATGNVCSHWMISGAALMMDAV